MPMVKGQPRAPQIPSTLPLAEAKRLALLKVLSKVQVNENGCWIWQGYCNPQWGYGHTNWRGKSWAVHRLMWTVMRGEIPSDKILCHHCDNPPCCNPEHIWLGTDKENHQDKARKGRHHYGKLTHCIRGHEFTPENTWVDKQNRRNCRICQRLHHQRPEYIEWRRNYQKRRRAEKRAQRQTEVVS